ncbi:MAG: hypothetical protein E7254_00870 [Lachnospiraceae bacterium]|nr:hypothetical protein [Lachnospiraceae bacterium]
MKKAIGRTVSLLLCATLLAGCQKDGNKDTKNTKGNGDVNETVDIADGLSLTEQLREKYAASEKTQYTDPMYNLPKDKKFVFENISDNFWGQDVYSMLEVYYDSALTKKVDIKIEEDYDNKRLILSPQMVFHYEDNEGSCQYEDGTWGSRSKFYLVQKYDFESDKKLDKPQVTVFTIPNELDTTTLKQFVAEDGNYQLKWNGVSGADYYEVYRYDEGMDFAELECSTESTSCTVADFKDNIDSEKRFKDIYGGTEVDVEGVYLMNRALLIDDGYFVVAKSNDGKKSGMSNMKYVKDIAGTLPKNHQLGQEYMFEGNTAMVLPAYTNVEMLDGSVAKYLIEYHGSTATKYDDGKIGIKPKIRNIPLELGPMYLTGMDYNDFLEDMKNVTEREDKLIAKSGTNTTEFDIPYVPTNEDIEPVEDETEAIEDETEAIEDETEAIEDETEAIEDETEAIEDETEAIEDETEAIEDETEAIEDETEAIEDETQPADDESSSIDLSSEIRDTVYANSAMGEWIAINLLAHEENISMSSYPEVSDTENLWVVVNEVWTQNGLIDMIEEMRYDYSNNQLVVSYLHTKEEAKEMQDKSISAAKDIANEIIKDGMGDFEKEEAINEYLCSNCSYNEAILSAINEDGTISEDAVEQNAGSFHPYGILVDKVGVCESYSEAFLLIAKYAGLEAIIQTGKMDGVNHEWNKVKIDGSWCILDVTNNDNEYIHNGLFNLTEETSDGILVAGQTDVIPEKNDEYQANDGEKEYYLNKGKCAQNADEAVDMISDLLKNSNMASVRISEKLTDAQVQVVATEVCNAAHIESVRYIYQFGIMTVSK